MSNSAKFHTGLKFSFDFETQLQKEFHVQPQEVQPMHADHAFVILIRRGYVIMVLAA